MIKLDIRPLRTFQSVIDPNNVTEGRFPGFLRLVVVAVYVRCEGVDDSDPKTVRAEGEVVMLIICRDI